MVEDHQVIWDQLRAQIDEVKEQSSTDLSIHDVHHYTVLYISVAAVIILGGVVVYLIRSRRAAARAAASPAPQGQEAAGAGPATVAPVDPAPVASHQARSVLKCSEVFTIGDEVQAGSVLLPASRRGRYLANIVRRQAVDGTGIKFNKDADRNSTVPSDTDRLVNEQTDYLMMNAEAKKKVDVLSEELLPYIMAEQERRTTLYRRVMTAIQSGEKGVTVAEIRNKPPAIIRKGLMYRCPTNRAPKEPDGSGVIMCEENIEPSPIMFDACLGSEDKELFVANNKYFFCNRHKIEGPDLPRNGTSVLGCSPSERTPLNFTSRKCALEDTDDVVVHYRYYPDRRTTNRMKVVSSFILFRVEVNQPSLPDGEEITPPVPEDDKNETTVFSQKYKTSMRRLTIPPGYKFDGIGKYLPNGRKERISHEFKVVGQLTKQQQNRARQLVALVPKPGAKSDLDESAGQTRLQPISLVMVPGQNLNKTSIYLTCVKCVLRGIMWRSSDSVPRNVETNKYRVRKFTDGQTYVEIDIGILTPQSFGDYFLIIQNDDGSEEKFKALTIEDKNNLIQIPMLKFPLRVGDLLDKPLNYKCKSKCELKEIICRGEKVPQTIAAPNPSSKTINIHFSGFQDENACVYQAIFKIDEKDYTKVVALVEIAFSIPPNFVTALNIVASPNSRMVQSSGPYVINQSYYYYKGESLSANKQTDYLMMTVNGIPMGRSSETRRSNAGSVAFYLLAENTERTGSIIIRITEFTSIYEAFYQATFEIGGERVTKNILEIGLKSPEPDAKFYILISICSFLCYKHRADGLPDGKQSAPSMVTAAMDVRLEKDESGPTTVKPGLDGKKHEGHMEQDKGRDDFYLISAAEEKGEAFAQQRDTR
ncbi:unnamed protein product [Spodoptera exigua]|nr:unnamed protein product [Spodoptera exigua]